MGARGVRDRNANRAATNGVHMNTKQSDRFQRGWERLMEVDAEGGERVYGHFARDGREHAIKLLDALHAPDFDPRTLHGLLSV
jgi:hypothetical protein